MPVMDDEPERERPEGAEEVGLWCNRCMLPSACRWPLTVRGVAPGHPSRVVGKMTVVLCIDCGSRLDADGNPVG